MRPLLWFLLRTAQVQNRHSAMFSTRHQQIAAIQWSTCWLFGFFQQLRCIKMLMLISSKSLEMHFHLNWCFPWFLHHKPSINGGTAMVQPPARCTTAKLWRNRSRLRCLPPLAAVVFLSEPQFMGEKDLKAMGHLWKVLKSESFKGWNTTVFKRAIVVFTLWWTAIGRSGL